MASAGPACIQARTAVCKSHFLVQNCPSRDISAVLLKHILRQVEPNRGNVKHGRPPIWILADPPWHIDAVGRRSHHQSPIKAVCAGSCCGRVFKRLLRAHIGSDHLAYPYLLTMYACVVLDAHTISAVLLVPFSMHHYNIERSKHKTYKSLNQTSKLFNI
jgi:hypothetical protein